MAGISSNNIRIQPHNHDLTSLLSLTETQLNRKIGTRYGVDFSTIGVGQTFRFTRSDNLFDDLCLIEKQIQTEVNDRTNAIEDITTADITKKPGLVKLKENGGLVNDTEGLHADFSELQQKLISGQNIATINGQSILLEPNSTVKNIELCTLAKLNEEIDKQEVDWNRFKIEVQSSVNDTNENVNNILLNVSRIQEFVVNMLGEVSSGQLYQVSAMTSGVSFGGGGGSGIVQWSMGCPSVGTCDPIVLNSSKSYYRKMVNAPLASCIDSDAEVPWFPIDASGIPTAGQDYMAIKFEVDFQFKDGSCVPESKEEWQKHSPWEWSEIPDWNTIIYKPTGQNPPPPITNAIFEVRGYWKFQTWVWYGKLVHVYTLNSSDVLSDEEDSDE